MHVPITVLRGVVQKSNICLELKLCALHQPLFLIVRLASGQIKLHINAP